MHHKLRQIDNSEKWRTAGTTSEWIYGKTETDKSYYDIKTAMLL